MSNKVSLKLFLSVITILCYGCAGTKSYLLDRGADAADIFTATAGLGVGAKVRAGFINAGLPLCWATDFYGLRGGEIINNASIGTNNLNVDMWLLFLGAEIHSSKNNKDPRRKYYMDATFTPEGPRFGGGIQRFTQFDVLVGLGPSVRIGFNPGELLDFILGWSTIDIYEDDIESASLLQDSSRKTTGTELNH